MGRASEIGLSPVGGRRGSASCPGSPTVPGSTRCSRRGRWRCAARRRRRVSAMVASVPDCRKPAFVMPGFGHGSGKKTRMPRRLLGSTSSSSTTTASPRIAHVLQPAAVDEGRLAGPARAGRPRRRRRRTAVHRPPSQRSRCPCPTRSPGSAVRCGRNHPSGIQRWFDDLPSVSALVNRSRPRMGHRFSQLRRWRASACRAGTGSWSRAVQPGLIDGIAREHGLT